MTQTALRPRTLRLTRRHAGTAALLVAVVGGTLGATTLLTDDSATAATATRAVVVRPVTHAGRAAAGYRVVADHRAPIECTDRAAAAVDDDIAFCGSSADYTVACWPAATAHRVLCLTDPFTRTLRRIRLAGAFPAVTAPRHPSPQALQLAGGTRYLVRDGGAAGSVREHPTWVPFYYQRHGTRAVWGPLGGDGVNRHHARWAVTVYRDDRGHGVRHGVTRAYYVGTAR
ncbi:hypothetical protein SAMN05443575_4280 [Jatrophihabitans endophyticus]|uniref:Uncharacterized protein n=1 Tax=Jatrophihabitans endophyticus TaxID=1206085 RepID=A0A1M5URF3_9ACTN|nr:hypothetical protein [Jatrophihabitans endophyticus]SHH65293.1 hypothetical protein SAMN05443575_4280 [Jatrophihabitans endophyticus]